MKIVHITHHYVDGWGYQDNLLPEYQERIGDDVVVISDNEHLGYVQNDALATVIRAKGSSYIVNGVRIRKIRCYLNTSNTSLLCRGLYSLLREEHPEIIMHHGVDSSTLVVAAAYKSMHSGVKLYVDSHADEINETHNRLWDFCYNRLLLTTVVFLLGNTVDRYFGVTPLRCDYLHDKFGVPRSRIGFLPIGCDTYSVEAIGLNRSELRAKYSIPDDAFVVVSGGKMDASKGTLDLIAAIESLLPGIPHLHLVLFGKASREVSEAADGKVFITRLGWCDRETTLSLLLMSDAACWPLLHTTLIEDAVACGKPLIVKASGNVRHFEAEGNGIFLSLGDCSDIIEALKSMIRNYSTFALASRRAQIRYSYSAVAQALKGGKGYGLC